jgi:putative tryptophan/tyrosine transport system substrate-binding protein
VRRRELIALGIGAALYPLAIRAQQKSMPVIGVLGPNPKVYASLNLEQDLRDLGWDSGHNIRLVFKGSAGSNDALSRLAAELVAQHADMILPMGDQAIIAAQQAAPGIPIVGVTDDMVGSKLVASMARPGGNTTGFSILASELNVKRLQLLHELAPQAARVGILADPTTVDTSAQLASAAQALHLELVTAQAANPEAVARALDQLAEARVGAVNILASPILDDARTFIIERLNSARLPAIYQWPEMAEAGGFAAYGPRLAGAIRAWMQIADKVLRGAHPAELPVQQPTAFELVINLKTAKTLGLTVPQLLLAQADEVIE